ncbi:A-kinase anchor protein 14 isoform X1 [Moschus berezovskii]|uniref:A-kinase anchor protein 14 isoform X1 n=1 Tax=Moschus berezovskii TaxID=68408 RepID=UPI002444449E|nr:A-kinase anchor protein 14 isoform X1 [Moschus berezovskii]
MIRSLSEKKMNVTKNVRFKEEANEDQGSTSQGKATENLQDITEIALTLTKDAITAAVKSAEEAENPVRNINWITHGEFTEEKGRKQVEEFVLNWEYQGRWKHYTEFLRKEDVIHSFYYTYCVRWSIPTARRPITQITASVYFTIKINKNKPPPARGSLGKTKLCHTSNVPTCFSNFKIHVTQDTPIDVSYVFEGHSLVHRPGMIRFREKWLRDIIEAKCILMDPNIFQFNSIGIFQNILGDF